MSGGQINITHCHILDFLKETSKPTKNLICSYYTDALFGLQVTFPEFNKSYVNNLYYAQLNKCNFIKENIKNEIKKDADHILCYFNKNSNFSSINEYNYIVERNQKCFMYLSHLHNHYIHSINIYANYDLLNYMISMPLKFRNQKKIIDLVLNKYFPEISNKHINNIGSCIFFKGTHSNWKLESINFKLTNYLNTLLRVLLKGNTSFINKYQTENYHTFLYKDFKYLLYESTSKLVENNILNSNQKRIFDKLPIKSTGVQERFAIIALAKLI